ncbi:hypothetical protein ACVXZY_01125 [Staphylococcus aureus]
MQPLGFGTWQAGATLVPGFFKRSYRKFDGDCVPHQVMQALLM